MIQLDPKRLLSLLAFLFVFHISNVQSQSLEGGFSFGSNVSEAGETIAFDLSGNMFVGGYFQNTIDLDPSAAVANFTSNGSGDMFLAKYDPSGKYLWGLSIGGIDYDQVYDIALANNGDVYITGRFSGTADFDPSAATANLTSAGNADMFIAKYTSNGGYLWAINMGGTSIDEARAIVTNGTNQVYITGGFQGTVDLDPSASVAPFTTTGNYDSFVASYDDAGNYLWGFQLGGTSYDQGRDIAIDQYGDIYVVGLFAGTIDFDPSGVTANLTSVSSFADFYLAKYTPVGKYQWGINVGATGFFSIDIGNVAVDKLGNVIVAGRFGGTADFDPDTPVANKTTTGILDGYVASYSDQGKYQWAINFNSLIMTMGGLEVDAAGDIFLAGSVQNPTDMDPGAGVAMITPVGSSDIFSARFNSGGAHLWSYSIGGAGAEEAYDLAYNGTNVALIGYFQGTVDFNPGGVPTNFASNGQNDIFVTRYSQPTFPVEWSRFTAEAASGGVNLHWATETEVNNDFFSIERSIDGRLYESLGSVNAIGNASNTTEYSFLDINPFVGLNYYRLKQIDIDGTFSYSPVVEATWDPSITPLSLYPNPATDVLVGQIPTPNDPSSQMEVRVYNSLGSLVYQRSLPWRRLLKIGVSDWNPGVYILEIVSGNRKYRQRFLKGN